MMPLDKHFMINNFRYEYSQVNTQFKLDGEEFYPGDYLVRGPKDNYSKGMNAKKFLEYIIQELVRNEK